MSSPVEQIKDKIDIVSLVSSYMKLERAGQNWKGKCPFHNEKTPSFFVSGDRGSYYCFGCQAKGDIFNFVQEFEGVDFMGSLKILAERAGVELSHYNREEKSQNDRLYSAMEHAVFFFQKKLSLDNFALEYLKKRGISDETIKKFRIGFASEDWRSVSDYLLEKGFSKDELFSVGLIKKTENSSEKFYDTFRGRIVFPINDSSGRTIAFSGRTLNSDPNIPKYLNSPETILFNKSETLFGLDLAKKSIREHDYSILVEGQMDLIMLHQIGLSNTVASSGTALTSEHLNKLRRFSNRIIMSFDGDNAGFKAADRSAKLALSLGMELKLVELPEGKDPADMALEDPEKLKDYVRQSKHIITFYTDSLLQKGLELRELGSSIQKNVLPYVARLPSAIERANFIQEITKKTFIKEEALWEDLSRVSNLTEENNPEVSPENNKTIEKDTKRRFDFIEKKIVGFILWQKSLENSATIEISSFQKKFFDISGKSFEEVVEKYTKEKEAIIFEAESYFSKSSSIEPELNSLFASFEEEILKDKFSETMILLQKAEMMRDSRAIMKYLEDCQRISKRINDLKNNN